MKKLIKNYATRFKKLLVVKNKTSSQLCLKDSKTHFLARGGSEQRSGGVPPSDVIKFDKIRHATSISLSKCTRPEFVLEERTLPKGP